VQQAAVKRTIRLAMKSALRDGNVRRACRFATPKARWRLIAGFGWFDHRDYKSCEEVVEAQLNDPFSRDIVASLRRRIVISHVRVRTDRARVSVGYREGADTDSVWVSLRKVDGNWRLTNSNWIPPPKVCGCEGG
jgi:hypothetical protein